MANDHIDAIAFAMCDVIMALLYNFTIAPPWLLTAIDLSVQLIMNRDKSGVN